MRIEKDVTIMKHFINIIITNNRQSSMKMWMKDLTIISSLISQNTIIFCFIQLIFFSDIEIKKNRQVIIKIKNIEVKNRYRL